MRKNFLNPTCPAELRRLMLALLRQAVAAERAAVSQGDWRLEIQNDDRVTLLWQGHAVLACAHKRTDNPARGQAARGHNERRQTMSTTYIASLVPEHWGDQPITAGTVAVLTEYARQGVSHATLAAIAEGIALAVDEAQHDAAPLWQAVLDAYCTGDMDAEGLLLAGASGDAEVAHVAASAVLEEARRTAELYSTPMDGLWALTPEDLVVAGCLAHMLLSRHADWSRSRVIWAVRGWVALRARYYAHGRYDA